jgi:Chalcone isomerase-like
MWKSVWMMSVWMTANTRQLAVATIVAVLSGAVGPGALPGTGQVQAATLEGQKFEDATVLAGRTLRLNGLGLRGVAWIKAYVTGLYLAAPSQDVPQILAMQGPKRLRMKVMLEAPSQEYTKAFLKGVRRNEPEKVQQALASRLTAFAAQIDSLKTIRAGDVVDMDYLPGVGTQLRLNNKAVGAAIEGEDFYRALLKIYIGDKPADKKMKEGLLRGGSTD